MIQIYCIKIINVYFKSTEGSIKFLIILKKTKVRT